MLSFTRWINCLQWRYWLSSNITNKWMALTCLKVADGSEWPSANILLFKSSSSSLSFWRSRVSDSISLSRSPRRRSISRPLREKKKFNFKLKKTREKKKTKKIWNTCNILRHPFHHRSLRGIAWAKQLVFAALRRVPSLSIPVCHARGVSSAREPPNGGAAPVHNKEHFDGFSQRLKDGAKMSTRQDPIIDLSLSIVMQGSRDQQCSRQTDKQRGHAMYTVQS